MAPFEEPLRCLAVSVSLDEAGEVDGIELEAFLNHVAGRHQWLSTTEWLFVEPPAEAQGHVTVALAEFRGACIVEFRPLSSGIGWLLRDVHIERNRPVPLSLFADVEAKCDEMGIPRINEAGGGDGRSSYRHFTKELEWG